MVELQKMILLIRPISREYPATSVARIAASRRVRLMSPYVAAARLAEDVPDDRERLLEIAHS
jgi:hypothetical protein